MVDNSNMPHPKCLGSQKNPGTEPKNCEKGPKLGFEYLPTSKTLHCVRTACALRAHCVHGIPLVAKRCVTLPHWAWAEVAPCPVFGVGSGRDAHISHIYSVRGCPVLCTDLTFAMPRTAERNRQICTTSGGVVD